MSRWTQGSTQQKLKLLGRLGDTVDFTTLPVDMQRQDIASAFASANTSASLGYFEVCGSAGCWVAVARDDHDGVAVDYYCLHSELQANVRVAVNREQRLRCKSLGPAMSCDWLKH